MSSMGRHLFLRSRHRTPKFPPRLGLVTAALFKARVLISRNARLGRASKINCGAAVHHDVKLADYCTVGPRAVLLGNVTVGEECYIGAGAVVLQRRTLGDGCIVGAGAVVTRDVEAGDTVVGVPARPLLKSCP